jgi:hypothetical protein
MLERVASSAPLLKLTGGWHFSGLGKIDHVEESVRSLWCGYCIIKRFCSKLVGEGAEHY